MDTIAVYIVKTDIVKEDKTKLQVNVVGNNLIDDLSYSIKTDDYRNKQILLSDEVFGSTPYNDLLTSNGYDTS